MAYISALEVKEIRKELKKQFPKYKFSVRKEAYSVEVSILSSDLDFQSNFPEGESYLQVNQYYINDMWPTRLANDLNKIYSIIKSAPSKAVGGEEWYDNSDSMIDYFDTAFYINMSVGRWNKPYEQLS
jgi:hypothetical protein